MLLVNEVHHLRIIFIYVKSLVLSQEVAWVKKMFLFLASVLHSVEDLPSGIQKQNKPEFQKRDEKEKHHHFIALGPLVYLTVFCPPFATNILTKSHTGKSCCNKRNNWKKTFFELVLKTTEAAGIVVFNL